MKGTTTQIGHYGEDLAAAHLIQNGFQIVRRNYRVSHNEIDIIAENEGYLIFVEVKTRSVLGADIPSRYGRPSRAVTYEKRERTLYAARSYLRSHPTEKRARMDVIEIYLQSAPNGAPQMLKLNWIQNAYRKQ